ncbi:hypothetical protein DIPPA_20669 [Diplonema papillatum]|nr:hypothetical protein DIPPA_20669 [Diplonema papillatum]
MLRFSRSFELHEAAAASALAGGMVALALAVLAPPKASYALYAKVRAAEHTHDPTWLPDGEAAKRLGNRKAVEIRAPAFAGLFPALEKAAEARRASEARALSRSGR